MGKRSDDKVNREILEYFTDVLSDFLMSVSTVMKMTDFINEFKRTHYCHE